MKTLMTSIMMVLLVSLLAVGAMAQSDGPSQQRSQDRTSAFVDNACENEDATRSRKQTWTGPEGGGGSDGADEKSFTDANGDGFDDDYADRVRNDVGEGESTRTDLSSSADDGSRKHQRSGTEEFDGDLKVFGGDNDGTQDGDMVHRTQGPGFDNEDTQIGPNEGEEYFGEESDLGDGDMVHEQVRGGNGRK